MSSKSLIWVYSGRIKVFIVEARLKVLTAVFWIHQLMRLVRNNRTMKSNLEKRRRRLLEYNIAKREMDDCVKKNLRFTGVFFVGVLCRCSLLFCFLISVTWFFSNDIFWRLAAWQMLSSRPDVKNDRAKKYTNLYWLHQFLWPLTSREEFTSDGPKVLSCPIAIGVCQVGVPWGGQTHLWMVVHPRGPAFSSGRVKPNCPVAVSSFFWHMHVLMFIYKLYISIHI